MYFLLLTPLAGVTAMTAWDLESRSLASLVSRQALVDGDETRGGLVWVEHLNIVVGERSLAERFYFDGLGCTRDPSRHPTKGTMWANVGSQQFHLAEESEDDPPQAVRGSIGVVLPNLEDAYSRLSELSAEIDTVCLERHEEGRLTVTCPWGNVFHCYDENFSTNERGDDEEHRGLPKMVAMHEDTGRSLKVRGGPGIRYLHVRCEDADEVASQYRDLVGSRVTSVHEEESEKVVAVVSGGVGPVHLVFETASTDLEADSKMDGFHLCIYVNDFASYYERLQDFVFTNPRFRHLDTCDTLDEALASRTFRFSFPKAPALEHETRSLTHKNFLKPLLFNAK